MALRLPVEPFGRGIIPVPVLGEDDKAAILTPVLLGGIAGDTFVGSSFFFDLEDEIVEVDLSSLPLLAASFFVMLVAIWAAFARASVSLMFGVLTIFATVGDGLNAGIGSCRASGDN